MGFSRLGVADLPPLNRLPAGGKPPPKRARGLSDHRVTGFVCLDGEVFVCHTRGGENHHTTAAQLKYHLGLMQHEVAAFSRIKLTQNPVKADSPDQVQEVAMWPTDRLRAEVEGERWKGRNGGGPCKPGIRALQASYAVFVARPCVGEPRFHSA